MERIGIRELRQYASQYIALVKQGHTVEVSERGTLVAMLVPPEGSRRERDRLASEGLLIASTSRTGRVRSPQPVSPDAGEPSNQELLDDERAERL